MKVVTKLVADLIPYVRNSRTHSDAQIAQIAASIKEFGWTNPILIDGENGIIAGHGRLLAARKLGQDKVPVIELAHMTEAQKRAYVIADNKLALNADWDHELLRLEIEDIENEINLNLLGFSNFELNQILGLDEIEQKSTTGEIDPDQFQMEHKCPKCGFEFDDDK
jgi:ParB-like chromosome segregation protein Spo0J